MSRSVNISRDDFSPINEQLAAIITTKSMRGSLRSAIVCRLSSMALNMR